MAQTTHGLRAILSHPRVYSGLQSLMGAHQAWTRFVADFVRPFPGMKVLDIGCGPGDILAYLPGVDYWGFDISESYISQAQKRFHGQARFSCKQLEPADLRELPVFDVVFALGLLHHLDDPVAHGVMHLAYQALAPGGRLLTNDPCLDPSQSLAARFLIRNDRGRNVRDRSGYEALAKSAFADPRVEVRHTRWIPYTHCFMECTK